MNEQRTGRGASGRWLLVGMVSALVVGCSTDAIWPDSTIVPVPPAGEDGWPVGAVAEHGFDPRRMALLHHDLTTRRIEEVDALLIARRGVLVYEGYFDPATGLESRHQLNSATKSVASMVVGVAVQEGLLPGYDVPIADLFPEAADLFEADPGKRGILLSDVLTMTAGLDWDRKDVRDRDRDDFHIQTAPDAVRYVLEKPLVKEPGTTFFYNSGCSMLLTGLIPNISGQEADAFAQEHLFEPLGIRDIHWQTTQDGTARGQDGLHMRGRDLLKLGQLYLQGGTWLGRQIVPAPWIQASFRPWTPSSWSTSWYGFQWWMYDYSPSGRTGEEGYGLIAASGYGGQKLFIVPELELVAVFFGCTTEGYDCGISDTVPEAVMYNYILPALVGNH